MGIYVWQMVNEAVNSLGGTVTYKQIQDYISSHYNDVQKRTIRAQTILCTVNHPSRVHYTQNKKPRKANGKYDFLFSTKRGEVTLYDPEVHGNYKIEIHNGKPMVGEEPTNLKFKELPSKKDRVPSDEIKNYANILKKKSQLILYGPPGTGKTYNATQLAEYFVRSNSSQSLTFKSAAIMILKEAKKSMHYTEISSKILNQRLVQTAGKTPEYTILKIMSSDIQHKGADSIFVKTGSGIYGLNPKINDYETRVRSRSLSENKNEFIKSVTFHQSYSYEDFIEGIKPSPSIDNQVLYKLEDGIFKRIVEDAEQDPSNRYVLLIDEVNRGNISKIFGELITLIESDKRGSHTLQLTYSKENFTVPENLFIIGTMNTADRSLIQVDAALRRRFAFVEVMPRPDLLKNTIQGVSLQNLLTELNQRITREGLREKQIGHSYFMEVSTLEDLQFVFAHEIVPLLQDYFFDNYEKLEEDILGSGFVDSKNMRIKSEWQKNAQRFIEILRTYFDHDLD